MLASSFHLHLDFPSGLLPSVLPTKSFETVSFPPLRALGTLGGAVGWVTALQTGMSRVRYPMVSMEPTQPRTETSTKNIDWEGKGVLWIGLTPYHLHVPLALKFESFKLLEPSESVAGLCRDSITFVHVLVTAHVTYFDFVNIINVTKWKGDELDM